MELTVFPNPLLFCRDTVLLTAIIQGQSGGLHALE